MLRLVLGKTQQRAQPRLVAVDVLLGGFQGLRNDVLLHVGEDVAVRVAHDLIQLELLAVVQAANVVHSRESIGKKPPGVVEVPALENLALRPGDLERVLQDLRIRVVVGKHGISPFDSTMASAPTAGQWELRPESAGFGGESPGTIAPVRWIRRAPAALATIQGQGGSDPESPKILPLWR